MGTDKTTVVPMWKDKSKRKLKKVDQPGKPKGKDESVGADFKRDEKIPLQPRPNRKGKPVTFDLHVAVTKAGTLVLKYVFSEQTNWETGRGTSPA